MNIKNRQRVFEIVYRLDELNEQIKDLGLDLTGGTLMREKRAFSFGKGFWTIKQFVRIKNQEFVNFISKQLKEDLEAEKKSLLEELEEL